MSQQISLFSFREEQAYQDQLKRLGKKTADKISDEFKKISLIEHVYPNFAGAEAINTENFEHRLSLLLPGLQATEIMTIELEVTIEELKRLLHEIRTIIYNFEVREELVYEIALAQLLSRKGNINPEQTLPSFLKDLPDVGAVGGKKRKTKRKTRRKTGGMDTDKSETLTTSLLDTNSENSVVKYQVPNRFRRAFKRKTNRAKNRTPPAVRENEVSEFGDEGFSDFGIDQPTMVSPKETGKCCGVGCTVMGGRKSRKKRLTKRRKSRKTV